MGIVICKDLEYTTGIIYMGIKKYPAPTRCRVLGGSYRISLDSWKLITFPQSL